MRETVGKMGVTTVAGYDVVRIGLGLLLLTAAALKGHQLATEPVAETGLLTSRWFLIAVVEFELFFGLWLMAGLWPKWTWRATLLCFGGFACVALYKALSGEASCGCFGKVPVNPWYTLIVDLCTVAALLVWRPEVARRRNSRRTWLVPVGCTFAAAGVLAAWTSGTSSSLWSDTSGGVPGLHIPEKVIDLGLLAEGESATASFELVNRGEFPLRIDDIDTDCACTVVEPAPKAILPGEMASIPVTINVGSVPKGPGMGTTPFRHQVAVRIERQSPGTIHTVLLTITGEVDSNSVLAAIPGVVDLGLLVVGNRARRLIQFRGLKSVLDAFPERVEVGANDRTVISIRNIQETSILSTREIEFVFTGGSDKLGHFESSVLVEVDAAKSHRLLIPVRGQLTESVVAEPRRLYFSVVPGNQGHGQRLRLSSPLGRELILNDIHCDLPVGWRVENETDVCELVLRVAPDGELPCDRTLKGSLDIEFKAPRTEVRVPIVIVFMGRSRGRPEPMFQSSLQRREL